jgi:hypothetical protein
MVSTILDKEMQDKDWREFLIACRQVLGAGTFDTFLSESWCAFTTFSRLADGWHIYLHTGFPDEEDLLESGTKDGGIWREAISYDDIAHVVIPRRFYWERVINGAFTSGTKNQNLDLLSERLTEKGIRHRKTDLILEVKLY